jgi:carboxyl-terminal processing protease
MMLMSYSNSRRSIYLPIIIAVCLAIGVLTGIFLPGSNSISAHSNIRTGNGKLDEIVSIIESSYVDTVNSEELEESAIPAILKKLDPHSVYIPARDLKRANEPLQGNFDGIGISFNLITDTIIVISTVPGGPSEKAGLLPGDKIIFVNDSLVAGRKITDEDAMGMLKGPRGTVVRLKILRKGAGELLSYEIKRAKIPRYSIDVAYMVNDKTGYIKILNFAVTTFDEFMTGLRELKSKGMQSLIIDLRGNSGGVMESAIRISNQFLRKGQLIVYTEGRAQPRNDAIATGGGEFETGNLAILIDESTASASEILAGAIQDNDRGTIIGRRSFGKGLVQEPVMLSDGSGMRITVARYYTPSGRSIQKPYDEGYEKYYEEFHQRLIKGESLDDDSILLKKLPKFTTPGGRILFGGGGIMPDNFVPVDTTGVSRYFGLVRISLIYRFALRYTEVNRETLKKYTEAGEMESYLDKQGLLDQFVKFAESAGVKKDSEGLRISGKVIHTQIKAYIARNIIDNRGFYPIWEEIDTTLKFAISYLNRQQPTD